MQHHVFRPVLAQCIWHDFGQLQELIADGISALILGVFVVRVLLICGEAGLRDLGGTGSGRFMARVGGFGV